MTENMQRTLGAPTVCEYLSVPDFHQHIKTQRPCTSTTSTERHRSISSVPSLATIRNFSTRSSLRPSSMPSRPGSSGSKISYEIPRLTKTPWELGRRKRNSVRRSTTKRSVFPSPIFKKLPKEIYDCIVEQLQRIHLQDEQHSASAFLKDLYNLSITSRIWNSAVTAKLYDSVVISTKENHPRMPKLKVKGLSRLKLLRRSLRQHSDLAERVRVLDLSHICELYQAASIEREEIVNQVASIVMVCPKLERLIGFHISYTHAFDRLSQALSTRRYLKERFWLLSDSTGLDPDDEDECHLSAKYYNAATDPQERFLELNSHYPNLTTLVLHQQELEVSLPLNFRSIIGTLRQLPKIAHLTISGFSVTSFSNISLTALPPTLQSLRLENLPGVNDKGLQRFANSQTPQSLRTLLLLNLEITSLVTISAFLSRFSHLANLTISQHHAPILPKAQMLSTDIPVLASSSLRLLHWEIRSQAGPPPSLHSPFVSLQSCNFPFTTSEPIVCFATSLLATSIKKGNFPHLRILRVPHDPQGLLQKLCKPKATALLPGDIEHPSSTGVCAAPFHGQDAEPIIATEHFGHKDSDSDSTWHWQRPIIDISTDKALAARTDSATSSPQSTHFDVTFDFKFGFQIPLQVPLSSVPTTPLSLPLSQNHLTQTHSRTQSQNLYSSTPILPLHCRQLAESRIIAARKEPSMQFRVFDPSGHLLLDKQIGGYTGTLESRIEYQVCEDEARKRAREMARYAEEEEDDELGGQHGDESPWITSTKDIIGNRNGEGVVEVCELFGPLPTHYVPSRQKCAVA